MKLDADRLANDRAAYLADLDAFAATCPHQTVRRITSAGVPFHACDRCGVVLTLVAGKDFFGDSATKVTA